MGEIVYTTEKDVWLNERIYWRIYRHAFSIPQKHIADIYEENMVAVFIAAMELKDDIEAQICWNKAKQNYENFGKEKP